jgi:predicted 3-demethylubiquinone-9 3-methyltransferase (glyoxalase superfamily)
LNSDILPNMIELVFIGEQTAKNKGKGSYKYKEGHCNQEEVEWIHRGGGLKGATMTPSKQKIVPHLWYDKEAIEAAELYTSIFPNSSVKNITTLENTPSGQVDTISFELAGQAFFAISAGPMFKFNPSISFLVACSTHQEVDTLWEALSPEGMVAMELGEYPFSERYGWTQDKYGLSWQVMHVGSRPIRQKITPFLMYVGEQAGKAEEAIRFYTQVFPDSKAGEIQRYGKDEEPEQEGTVRLATFTLAGQDFAALDSGLGHDFTFNEAISLMVNCDSQAEIDETWEKLSAVPEAEQCGWLKDRYGVSWQIRPTRIDEMMESSDREARERVTEAFLAMKKYDLAELERAYGGE